MQQKEPDQNWQPIKKLFNPQKRDNPKASKNLITNIERVISKIFLKQQIRETKFFKLKKSNNIFNSLLDNLYNF